MAFPSLIDEAMWERAQTLKIERRSLARRNTKEFLPAPTSNALQRMWFRVRCTQSEPQHRS